MLNNWHKTLSFLNDVLKNSNRIIERFLYHNLGILFMFKIYYSIKSITSIYFNHDNKINLNFQ